LCAIRQRYDGTGSTLAEMPRDASAGLVVRPDLTFNGVKVFSATMFAPREQLGETVTAWMAANPQLTVTEFVVTQSSDSQFHCVAITVFYFEKVTRR
jgi:hypothetical protein